MPTSTISIEVDSDAARAFDAASADEKRKLQLLLNLRLKELMAGPPRRLNEIMNEISSEAEARGLTPEFLATLLQDE